MKKNLIFLLIFPCCSLWSQDLTIPENWTAPNPPQVDYGFQPGDFDPPPADEVMTGNVRILNYTKNQVRALSLECPDDETGKRSAWYASLQNWFLEYEVFEQSKKRQDLRNLIDNIFEVCSMPPGFKYSEQHWSIRHHLSLISAKIIDDVADHLAAQNGSLDQATLGGLVDLYKIENFISNSLWGTDWGPLLVEGVVVIDPEFVIQRLKSGTWESAERFLRNDESADEFFSSCTADGPSSQVLKDKYLVNKQLCHTKYEELKHWIEPLKAQSEQ